MERHVWHNLVFFPNLTNDARIKACLNCFDNGGYTRIQFLRAVSYSDDVDDVPTTSGNVAPSAGIEPPDLCEVSRVEERDARHALIPCGHSASVRRVCTGRRGNSWQ